MTATRPWMRLAPLHALLVANHDRAVRTGLDALASKLGAPVHLRTRH